MKGVNSQNQSNPSHLGDVLEEDGVEAAEVSAQVGLLGRRRGEQLGDPARAALVVRLARRRRRDPPQEAPHRPRLLLQERVQELHRVLLALVPEREWTICQTW